MTDEKCGGAGQVDNGDRRWRLHGLPFDERHATYLDATPVDVNPARATYRNRAL
ncbi:MAG: hypothetical protein ABSF69_27160 [Polyangiaceae bacterium]